MLLHPMVQIFSVFHRYRRINMQVLVLNGSPKGDNSITLFTAKYLEKHFPDDTFTVLHVGQRIRSIEKDISEASELIRKADLLLFCYPVYTFLVPSQLHRFIELMKSSGLSFTGKYASQISTSKHFYDVTAHRFIEENCSDLGLMYLEGLSADMDDLLSDRGRKEALDFWGRVRFSVRNGFFKPPVALQPSSSCSLPVLPFPPSAEITKKGSIVIVTDYDPTDHSCVLPSMIESFRSCLPYKTSVVNLCEFPFAGGCLGCFRCAADGTCVYKDGFDAFLRENIQSAQSIVYAFTIRDHSMGSRFKMYDDRQFCNGHRTVTMGKPVAYLVEGNLDREPNLSLLIESRAEVGGNPLAGIAVSTRVPEQEIVQVAHTLAYMLDSGYTKPKNFYGVGGLKIFRDLIYQMQGLMRADHRFYKEHGFYDFPQKKPGIRAAMYLVGGLMRNKRLQKKIGGKMTEGMVLPYKKVLEKE